MERTWKLEVGGFNFEVTRYGGVVRIECSCETPGMFLQSTADLTLEQSKRIEAVFRAANRAAAGEGK